MTLPASGAISLSQVNTELGRAWNQWIDMNDMAVRNLAGNNTYGTQITMWHLYGKSSYTPLGGYAEDIYFRQSQNPTTTTTYTQYSTCHYTGGKANYTFSWSWYNGGGAISLSETSSQTVTVKATFGRGGGSLTGTLQCVVTDGTGASKTYYATVEFSVGTLA